LSLQQVQRSALSTASSVVSAQGMSWIATGRRSWSRWTKVRPPPSRYDLSELLLTERGTDSDEHTPQCDGSIPGASSNCLFAWQETDCDSSGPLRRAGTRNIAPRRTGNRVRRARAPRQRQQIEDALRDALSPPRIDALCFGRLWLQRHGSLARRRDVVHGRVGNAGEHPPRRRNSI
jgi:hypothetical protein